LMTENELEDLQHFACPAVPVPVNHPGWARRAHCDECRQGLGYMGVSLVVPEGTPVLCAPCARSPEVRTRWKAR
jgi:hypothetical protein